ncbi:CatB-related O-acetyltransferase [Methylobacterium sp. NEAU 140]|uniref:CatB-related O-acetyltransferase n=1 Tax=Methylobacterium sp. NEAU 140 TaxID=3064945 RepID=UPI0027344D9C|nr:CatB-related O-acetyltransferase [Methylobacterium sp. NEAU 140]MDP4026063.1 CatB-related O-acetyltransferase [Methylobacterium sp. NEAU 140]
MAATAEDRKAKLFERGVMSAHLPPFGVPEACVFEAPCHVGTVGIDGSLRLGAFSYVTSGYVRRCEIGRYCSVEEGVQVGRLGHPDGWVTTSLTLGGDYRTALNIEDPRAETWRLGMTPPAPAAEAATVIGNDVAVGYGATILPGVTVGDGAVIRPMAVVVADVPPYAVVDGSPALVREMRLPDPLIARFLALRWWRFALWDLDRAAVTDPERFLDAVEAKVAAGLQPYRPGEIRVADL